MKCLECSAKCALVETMDTAKLYECPDCCNEFSVPKVRAATRTRPGKLREQAAPTDSVVGNNQRAVGLSVAAPTLGTAGSQR